MTFRILSLAVILWICIPSISALSVVDSYQIESVGNNNYNDSEDNSDENPNSSTNEEDDNSLEKGGNDEDDNVDNADDEEIGQGNGGSESESESESETDNPENGGNDDDDDPENGGNDDDDDPENGGNDDDDDPENGGNDDDDPENGGNDDDDDPENGGNDDDDDPENGGNGDDDDPENGGNDDDDDPENGGNGDDDDPENGGNDDDDDPENGGNDDDDDPENGGNDDDDDPENGGNDDDDFELPAFFLVQYDQVGDISAKTPFNLTSEENEGNYILTIRSLEGSFRIEDEIGDKIIGAVDNAENVTSTSIIQGITGGAPFSTERLFGVTLSFDYSSTIESSGDVAIRCDVTGLSGTLPILYINVYKEDENGEKIFDDEIIDPNLAHKEKFIGEYWLDLNGCEWLAEEGAQSLGSPEKPLDLEIKARGNFTRTAFSKKPFKIKLEKKQALLGLTKSKHFALLAHADDGKGYTRNFMGFNLGKRIGLPWTPWQQPVELVINGDYRGLYFATESIRVDENRVNIVEQNDEETAPDLITGGYIVELDNYAEDESIQISMPELGCSSFDTGMLRITFDSPEVLSDEQRAFLNYQFSTMNNLIGENSDELWSYLDLDDAVRYYLVNEIMNHLEAYSGSTYLFRDRGEGQKWHFSPLWDFGNAFPTIIEPECFFYERPNFHNVWVHSFRENEKFNDRVIDTWLWFMSNKYEGIEDDMDNYLNAISEAVQANHIRWKNAPIPNKGLAHYDNSDLEGRRAYVKRALNHKLDWLKTQFGDYTEAVFPEPERDDTPAAELPGTSTSIEKIGVNQAEDVAPAYYNLQGIRIANPAHGEMVIRRDASGNTKKIIVR